MVAVWAVNLIASKLAPCFFSIFSKLNVLHVLLNIVFFCLVVSLEVSFKLTFGDVFESVSILSTSFNSHALHLSDQFTPSLGCRHGQKFNEESICFVVENLCNGLLCAANTKIEAYLQWEKVIWWRNFDFVPRASSEVWTLYICNCLYKFVWSAICQPS